MDNDKALVVFQGKNIRRAWYEEEWWFVLEDIVAVLTDSSDIKQYIHKMRQRDEQLAQGWVQIVHPLPITTHGGSQNMNCVNTKGAFRIIQSIPSPKAEPFKRWLARVGYERVQEIENPELAQNRMRDLYRAKGYSDEWIDKRMRGIAVRQELTGEWKGRGVEEGREFAILTNEISKATFGKTVEEYKEYKGLKRQNLRDHMDDLELIFNMLGEKVTTEITKVENAQGLPECRTASTRGGGVAGRARDDTERELGRPVINRENYLEIPEKEKRKQITKR